MSGGAGGRAPGGPPRRMGVIEAFTAVTQSCPSGAVRTVAENALETVKREGAGALPMQAYLVLTSMRGWHGDRASQVRASLEAFLAESEARGGRGPER